MYDMQKQLPLVRDFEHYGLKIISNQSQLMLVID